MSESVISWASQPRHQETLFMTSDVRARLRLKAAAFDGSGFRNVEAEPEP